MNDKFPAIPFKSVCLGDWPLQSTLLYIFKQLKHNGVSFWSFPLLRMSVNAKQRRFGVPVKKCQFGGGTADRAGSKVSTGQFVNCDLWLTGESLLRCFGACFVLFLSTSHAPRLAAKVVPGTTRLSNSINRFRFELENTIWRTKKVQI